MPKPLNRRGFLLGLGAVITAPAIIRPGLLMPVKPMLSDGVPLISLERPWVDVMWRNSLGELITGPFRKDHLRPARLDDRHIVGVILTSTKDGKLFAGDAVALR